MTVIGVPYHLDEYLPDLDLTPDPAELIIPELPAGEIWSRLAVLYTAVARAVAGAGRADGGRPVVVACGDCLTALGTVTGLQAAGADPAVVWFDAHGDVQTPETTSSGYLAGMVLRLLTGHRPELIASTLYSPPPSFAEVNPDNDVPAAVEAVVLKCLAKKPDERYQTPAELAISARHRLLRP